MGPALRRHPVQRARDGRVRRGVGGVRPHPRPDQHACRCTSRSSTTSTTSSPRFAVASLLALLALVTLVLKTLLEWRFGDELAAARATDGRTEERRMSIEVTRACASASAASPRSTTSSLDDPRGRAGRAARPVGLGQDDAAAHHRRPGVADRGHGPVRRRGRHRRSTSRERSVGFVFQHYALFRHMTVFENVAFGLRVQPRARAAVRGARSASGCSELLELVQLDRLADRYPVAALRRPAAARRAGPRAGGRAAGAAARRAVRRARRQGAQGAAPLAAPAARRDARHQRLRHPRPGRGARGRRPGRRDEPRPDRAGRHAARRSTTTRRRRSSTSSWAT